MDAARRMGLTRTRLPSTSRHLETTSDRPALAAAVFSCPTVCYCIATGSLDGRRHLSPAGIAVRGFFVIGSLLELSSL